MSDPCSADALFLDRRRFGGWLAAGVAALSLTLEAALAAEKAGRVDDVFGKATARSQRDTRALAQGETVFIGDTVATAEASRLGMMIGEATKVRLGANARLKIDRYVMNAGGVLTLQSGPMTFARPEGAAPEPVTIRGAFGQIAVRGTHFFCGPSRGKAGVLVLRGSVAVRSGGATVLLSAGEGTDIARRGGKPSDVTRWSNERIAEALASMGQAAW